MCAHSGDVDLNMSCMNISCDVFLNCTSLRYNGSLQTLPSFPRERTDESIDRL